LYKDALTKDRSGLVDENETAEQAALRELKEETGYIGEEVVDVSAILAADPGHTLNSTGYGCGF